MSTSPAPNLPELAPYLDSEGLVEGRYQVIRKLGSGGMGAVYEALQVRLRKRVALKVLRPELASHDTAVKRFLREARAASSIEQRNVVDIIDFGELPGGAVYYVMEYLEGEDLSDLLKRQGRLSWARARNIFLQVVRALKAAHESGIVHRDIKPANVFIVAGKTDEGPDFIKVLDFGIAKTDNASPETQGLTGTSELMGTAYYMAPEQANGEQADARTDIYAFGVLMFEVLTGRVPFEDANAFKVLFRHTTEAPPAPRQFAPELPPSVEALVLESLAKRREDRPQSMRALEGQLLSIDEQGRIIGDPRRFVGTSVPPGGTAPSDGTQVLQNPTTPARTGATEYLGEQGFSTGPVTGAPDQTGHPRRTGDPAPAVATEPGRITASGRLTASGRSDVGRAGPAMAGSTGPLGAASPSDDAGRSSSSKSVALVLGGFVAAMGLGTAVAFALLGGEDDSGPSEPPQVARAAAPEPTREHPEPDGSQDDPGEEPAIPEAPVPEAPSVDADPQKSQPSDTPSQTPAGDGDEPPTSDSEGSAAKPPVDEAPRRSRRESEPTPKKATDASVKSRLVRKAQRKCKGSGLTLSVTFAIDGNGKVLLPRVKPPHQSSEAARCVLPLVKGQTFPATGQLRDATLTLSL